MVSFVEIINVMNQSRLPLLEEINTYRSMGRVWLHVPGHGGGLGLPAEIVDFMAGVAEIDLTELPGLDDLHCAVGAIAAAQSLAAEVWHADETFFLVNGGSSGVLAMVLATCLPGDVVLAPRNAHGSFYHAAIMSGALPRYLPVVEKDGVPLNVTVQAVKDGFTRYPNAKAIFLTSPSYHGVCADVSAIATIARQHGALLLLDEAHGAHLGFSKRLPPAQGHLADLRVQSWHKTLGALTPGAVLHRHGEKVEQWRLRSALQSVQTSSPSYPVLLSLDATRKQMASTGEQIVDKMANNAASLRQATAMSVPFLEPADVKAHGFLLDPTRVTFLTGKKGLCGFAAARQLYQQGIDIELAQPGFFLALIGPGYRNESTSKTAVAIRCLSNVEASLYVELPPLPGVRIVLSPRDAHYAPSEALTPAQAKGRISAGMVISYPPGNPLLVPGEQITEEVITYLDKAARAGVHFRGLDSQGRLRVCL
jgi:arginine/lysine/ornithine decarboxylase